MLNAKNERMLAYIEKVTNITPIENADRLEAVHINGWVCVCGKGEFHIGDLGVFFEIDSQLPNVPPFNEMEFLVKKKFKIKSQKIRGVISQGLFVPLSVLTPHFSNLPIELHEDCTEVIGVTYAEAEDNKRKSNNTKTDKYKQMARRRPALFKKPWARWMMKRAWGRKVMFFFFGKKKDTKNLKAFPTHFDHVHRTDEERIENAPWLLEDKTPWIKTLKIDGTSSTYILERKKKENEFYVLSRNVRQLDEEQECYHEVNVYWEVAKKYKIKEFLQDMLDENSNLTYVCLQGETAGEGIQGNPHKLDGINFFGFNLIDSINGRWNTVEAAKHCHVYSIPWVPIIDENYILPDTMEEMKLSADGPCDIPGSSGLREGFVYRSLDGKRSFKNVSREYLLKHH